MNATNFQHAGYALLMFFLVGYPLSWLTGAAFGIAFFLGREHAQVQRKHGVSALPAFNPRLWSLDARLDLAAPVVAVALAYAGTRWLGI